MSINDLRMVDDSRPIETDLCLIGSGPAGWAIAEELKDSGLRILMLESGGHTVEPDTAVLNEIEDVGTRLFNGRSRVLGGTSYMWNGRCMPFDDIDYEKRTWLPRSGWPFGPETMAPYVNRASEHLAAGPYYNGRTRRPMPRGLVPRPGVDPALMRATWWENPATILFGQFLTQRRNPNLWVLLGATVTHLNTDPFGRQVQSVEVADRADRRLTVRAPAFVLCAGGIENPRIMLYSNRINPNGIGNEHDTVGRFLMDHPRDFELIARVDARDTDRFRDLFGPHVLDNERGRHDFIFGYSLSPERQQAEQLLNTAAWPYEEYSPSDPFAAMTRLARGPRDHVLRDAVAAVSDPALLLKAIRSRRMRQRIRRKVDRIGFLVTSEQVPDPDSRVQLSGIKDRLGLPISRVDWRVHEAEARSQAALAQSIRSEFARLGLPVIRIADWVRDGNWKGAKFVDGCHPIATTRMSVRPEDGVVDENCQVHGVSGLYVAGSSVFPTAGHANPTLMIVALAIRLADHLRHSVSTKATTGAARRQPALQVAV